MTRCTYCGAPALDESTRALESATGPAMITKWRCLSQPEHWWSGLTVLSLQEGGEHHHWRPEEGLRARQHDQRDRPAA